MFAAVWRLVCTSYRPSLTSYGMSYFLIPHSLCPTPFSGRALLDCGFFFLQPVLLFLSAILLPFLVVPLCHSCYDVIWPQPARPIWACCLFFFLMTQYGHLGFVLHCLWAFLSHLFPLGHPWPFAFLGLPWLSLHSHERLLIPLGFSDSITLSFILKAHGLALNPLLSLPVLLWACCGPFSLFDITYYSKVCYFSLSGPL